MVTNPKYPVTNLDINTGLDYFEFEINKQDSFSISTLYYEFSRYIQVNGYMRDCEFLPDPKNEIANFTNAVKSSYKGLQLNNIKFITLNGNLIDLSNITVTNATSTTGNVIKFTNLTKVSNDDVFKIRLYLSEFEAIRFGDTALDKVSINHLPNNTAFKLSFASNIKEVVFNCSTKDLTNFNGMFYNNRVTIQTFDFDNLDMSGAEDISGMLYGCYSDNTLDYVFNKELPNLKYCNFLFGNCTFKTLTIDNKTNFNNTCFSYIFYNTTANELIFKKFNVTNGDFTGMLSTSKFKTNIDFDGFNYDGDENYFNGFFSGISSNTLKIKCPTNFIKKGVISTNGMFYHRTNYTNPLTLVVPKDEDLTFIDLLNSFDMSTVKDISNMFYNLKDEATSLMLNDLTWKLDNVVNCSWFLDFEYLTNPNAFDRVKFLELMDTSKLVTMIGYFYNYHVEKVDLSEFNLSSLKIISFLFAFSEIDYINLNGITGGVICADGLFRGSNIKEVVCNKFNLSECILINFIFENTVIEKMEDFKLPKVMLGREKPDSTVRSPYGDGLICSFYNCCEYLQSKLKDYGIEDLDVSGLRVFINTFGYCDFEKYPVDLSKWSFRGPADKYLEQSNNWEENFMNGFLYKAKGIKNLKINLGESIPTLFQDFNSFNFNNKLTTTNSTLACKYTCQGFVVYKPLFFNNKNGIESLNLTKFIESAAYPLSYLYTNGNAYIVSTFYINNTTKNISNSPGCFYVINYEDNPFAEEKEEFLPNLYNFDRSENFGRYLFANKIIEEPLNLNNKYYTSTSLSLGMFYNTTLHSLNGSYIMSSTEYSNEYVPTNDYPSYTNYKPLELINKKCFENTTFTSDEPIYITNGSSEILNEFKNTKLKGIIFTNSYSFSQNTDTETLSTSDIDYLICEKNGNMVWIGSGGNNFNNTCFRKILINDLSITSTNTTYMNTNIFTDAFCNNNNLEILIINGFIQNIATTGNYIYPRTISKECFYNNPKLETIYLVEADKQSLIDLDLLQIINDNNPQGLTIYVSEDSVDFTGFRIDIKNNRQIEYKENLNYPNIKFYIWDKEELPNFDNTLPDEE